MEKIILTEEQETRLRAAFDTFVYCAITSRLEETNVILGPLFSDIRPEEVRNRVYEWYSNFTYVDHGFDPCALLAYDFFDGLQSLVSFGHRSDKEFKEKRRQYENSNIPFDKILYTPTDNSAHNVLLGIALQRGLYMRRNTKLGLKLILKEAEKGYPYAKELLFFLYREGVSNEINYNEALRCHRDFTAHLRAVAESEKTPLAAARYLSALYLDADLTIRMRRIPEARATLRILREACDDKEASKKTVAWRRVLYHETAASLEEILCNRSSQRRHEQARDRILNTIPVAEDYEEIHLKHALYMLEASFMVLSKIYEQRHMEKASQEYQNKTETFNRYVEHEDAFKRIRLRTFANYIIELLNKTPKTEEETT
ncbi:MAG: hypothetical protein IJW16_05145 [Clostridia bacterium]|nr:hypothetical protein [Clostridia bacterium]